MAQQFEYQKRVDRLPQSESWTVHPSVSHNSVDLC